MYVYVYNYVEETCCTTISQKENELVLNRYESGAFWHLTIPVLQTLTLWVGNTWLLLHIVKVDIFGLTGLCQWLDEVCNVLKSC